MNNSNLTISIMYYGRPNTLSKCIYNILPWVISKNYIIKIYDDHSPINLKKNINQIKKYYNNIFYVRNKKRLGHDRNFLKIIKDFKTNYIWPIGDSTNINTKKMDKFDKFINNNNKILVIKNELVEIKKTLNLRYFFREYSWHLLLLGSTIYHKDIKKFKIKTQSINFPHLNIIINYIYKNKIIPKFYPKVVLSNFKKKSYWSKKIFETFFLNLEKTIENFQFFSKNDRIFAIKKHNEVTRIFSLKSLLFYRIDKLYSFKIFKKYKYYLEKFTDTNITFALLITLFPTFILNILIKIYFYKNIFKK
jgi:hypothetical protein